jgi:arginyl-tRNA synthetase
MNRFFFSPQKSVIAVIKKVIKKAVFKNIRYLSELSIDFANLNINVEKCRNVLHGDYASNIAMILGFKSHEKIINFAQLLKKKISKNKLFSKIEISNQGFINFFISDKFISKYLSSIIGKNCKYLIFKPKKLFYNIEFVSANPTGLLHIAHARNGVFGATLTNV